jgi:hypothetical protein
VAERDVEWSLKATDNTGHATESAASGFEHLGREADKASRKVDELGDQTGQLARKMAEARVAALALAREFDKTGDAKILRDFQKANAEAAKLGRVAKTLKADVVPDGKEIQKLDGLLGKFVQFGQKAGIIAADATVDGLKGALDAVPGGGKGLLYGALVGSAVLAAPMLAAIVEGAVVAGVGAGGIAAGLVLGAKDPAVAAAYQRLGNVIMQSLQEDAKPFAQDLLSLAPKFETAFDRERPAIARIFKSLAADVGPIADRMLEALHNLMPAIEHAAMAAGPILRSIAEQLPALASDIGDLLDAFAMAGPGGAAAIGLIIFQLRGLIELLALGAKYSAPGLNFLGKLAELSGAVPKTGDRISVLSGTLDKSAHSAGLTAEQYAQLAGGLENTATQAQLLNDTFSRLFAEQMGVDQANLAVNMGLQTLTKTIKDNKKSLDESTESGAQNNQVILQQIENLQRKRDADIAAGNGTQEASQAANAAYVSQLEGLRKLLYSLGLNHAEVDKLINSYEQLAKPQTKYFTTVYRTQGTPPGASDEKTGHSRTGTNDYSGLSGWAPAQFAAGARMALAGEAGTSNMPHQPPIQVHAESSIAVMLDGAPFQAYTVRTTRAAEKRQAWRNRVGPR